MKKTVVISCLILISINVFSQKCKLAVDKKDAISGKEIKESKYVAVGEARKTLTWLHFLKNSSDTIFLIYSFNTYGQDRNIVAKDQEFKLKLENGSTVSCKSIEQTIPKSTATQIGVSTLYEVKCIITYNDAVLISKNNPIAITTLDFSINKGVSIDFNKKQATALSKDAECIAQ